MASVAFFCFSETDREAVLLIKGRAVNPAYSYLDFRVQDLLKRWDTTDRAVIRQAISKSIDGASRTIVFVGEDTFQSYWVPQEVTMTIEERKPVFAIRLKGTTGLTPKCLSENGIQLFWWSEERLQELATK